MAREVAPRAREIDEQGVVVRRTARWCSRPACSQNIEGLRRLGVMGMGLPREVGGSNFPFTVGAVFMECLSRACTNTLLLYAFYQGPAVMILRFGTPTRSSAG